jgi:GTPase SAR1 family protein
MAPATTMRGEKARPRNQSMQVGAAGTSKGAGTGAGAGPRPGLGHRTHSAPMTPGDRAERERESPPHDGDEIANDSFFQRYHFPQPGASVAEEPQDSDRDRDHDPAHPNRDNDADSSSDTEGPLSPTHAAHRQQRKGADSQNHSQGQGQGQGQPDASPDPETASGASDDTPVLSDLTFAVLGARGVGKSTFIRRALGLPDATAPQACTRRWTIDGTAYLVRFLEMSFNDVQIGDRHHIKWPETVHDMATPRVDGALTLYDVTSQDSLARVPEMLNILAKSGLPFVLAACKCDQHPAHRQVDPQMVEQKAVSFLGHVNAFSTSEGNPDTHRQCLSYIIRAAIAARRPRSKASSRRRATSSAVLSLTQKELWARKHERASSEISSQYSRKGSLGGRSHRYKPSDVNKTFFNEESPTYDSDDSGDQSDTARSIMTMQPSDENGYTFDQLVDRLLAQPMSKNDTKYVSVFLALYRRFGTPSQLLEAILKRFEALGKNRDTPLIRVIAQLRYLAVLHQWVAFYPGDFAFPATRKLIRRFAQSLASNREFSVAAREILQDLEAVAEDDDTEWACSDRQRAQSEQLPAFYNTVLEDSEDDDFTRAIGHMSMGSDTLSSMTMNSKSSTNGSYGSTITLATQVERNERLARQLEPNPLKTLSKIQWHQFMACEDEVIAKELTRMDWIMFSLVRPRDLIRDCGLSTSARKECKQLENVARMTAHFNHIHLVVVNYILLRDKPKHRALMLEKWMRVARQVRKLNNYNSLGAIHAGVRSTPIRRLIATHDLVPTDVHRDFLKLDILMGPQKSHFSYRLAWDNSSGERIPYIPLYRRDLVSASEGSSTFVGTKPLAPSFSPHPGTPSVFGGPAGQRDSKEAPPGGVVGKERINWRKFEIMGDVVVGIQRAQGTPYPAWKMCEEVRGLVLDVKIVRDDDVSSPPPFIGGFGVGRCE